MARLDRAISCRQKKKQIRPSEKDGPAEPGDDDEKKMRYLRFAAVAFSSICQPPTPFTTTTPNCDAAASGVT